LQQTYSDDDDDDNDDHVDETADDTKRWLEQHDLVISYMNSRDPWNNFAATLEWIYGHHEFRALMVKEHYFDFYIY
jgi:hypothetical protein